MFFLQSVKEIPIYLALNSDFLDVIGITTVYGNTSNTVVIPITLKNQRSGGE